MKVGTGGKAIGNLKAQVTAAIQLPKAEKSRKESSTCLLCLLPKDRTAKSPGTKAFSPRYTKSAAYRVAPRFQIVPDSSLLLIRSNPGALRAGNLSPASRSSAGNTG